MRKSSKIIIVILVIIIVLLIGLIMLMSFGDVSKKESSDNKALEQKSTVETSEIIKLYKDMIADYIGESYQYSVVDINNDHIPELFIYTQGVIGNSIIADTNVYTYDENLGDEANNYIVSIGILSGRVDNNTIFYKMNDGTLLSVMGRQGYETTSYYSLENDWLVRTSFSSKETQEYLTGDNVIIFKPCTDTSLLDEYK